MRGRSTGRIAAAAILVIIAVLAIIAAITWFVYRRQQTERLRNEFGPEYDRTVREYGDRGRAEAALTDREKRVAALDLRDLTASQRDHFREEWRAVQARFVDDPTNAVEQADRLIRDVMAARGYPVADFDGRAADLSVDYPTIVENYRTAHAIALRNQRGEANTEDLRQAMVSDRALFDELLGTAPTESTRNMEGRNERAA
jgi:type II secretory pathway pseudopilin PulG